MRKGILSVSAFLESRSLWVRTIVVLLALCLSASVAPSAPAIVDVVTTLTDHLVHLLTDPVIQTEDAIGE